MILIYLFIVYGSSFNCFPLQLSENHCQKNKLIQNKNHLLIGNVFYTEHRNLLQKKSAAVFLFGTLIFNKSSVRLSVVPAFLIPKFNLGVTALLGVLGVFL